jgi:hypothetical protein
MKFPILILLIFLANFSQNVNAQENWQQKIKFAFGKAKDWQKVRTLSYHLDRFDAENRLINSADYLLDFINQSIQETKIIDQDTIQNYVSKGQSYQIKNRQKYELAKNDITRLSATLYYNFFNFFVRENIEFEYLKKTEYRKQKAHLIRIKDLENQQTDLDIWVADHNYLILTSSTLEDGKYQYFADESNYQKIYRSIKFPLLFEIFENNKAIRKGVFSKCRVN